MNNQVQVGDSILLTIKRLGINGEGVGFYKRQAVFVEDSLPGEIVEVEISEIKDKYAYGHVTKFKTRSDARVEPKCPYYHRCGGCQLQHMSYEEQLLQKMNLVKESFSRYFDGNVEKIEFRNTIGMENPWEYRNKSQLPTRHDGEKVVVGIYMKDSNKLVYIDKCLIESQLVGKTTGRVLQALTEGNVEVYNPRFQTGALRALVVRGFEETNEVQVTAVLTEENRKIINILKKIPNVTSMNYSINSDLKSINILGLEVINIAGKKEINGKLFDLQFTISPSAFFQLNTKQMTKLYQEIKKACDLKGDEKLIDCYCGIGSIGMYLAPFVSEVRGIDNNKIGIENANHFAKINKISNARFYYGEILPHLHDFKKNDFNPDIIIVNPPRKGLELNIINYLQKSNIKKIVYVSCNPSTLAKNINHLQKEYKIVYVQPLDMFPQTMNVETVVLLERK